MFISQELQTWEQFKKLRLYPTNLKQSPHLGNNFPKI
jgi:hypothetical protein